MAMTEALRRLVAGAPLLAVPAAVAATPPTPPDPPPPYLIVLGVAQDGGAPHAGCRRECCAPRWTTPGLRRSVACLGIVEPATGARWLIDATPDFPRQLHRLAAKAPPAESDVPTGILLTHAHMGHYTGLAYLGTESMGTSGVPVYAMPRLAAYLSENGPWDQLVRLGNVELEPLAAGEPLRLGERVTVVPIPVPHRDEYSGTVGYRIEGSRLAVLYVPDIDAWDRWDRDLAAMIGDVDVAYLDGTFYDAAELPGRDMSLVPHPPIVETMERLASLPAAERSKVRFIHLNHTNPALRPDSPQRQAVEAAGFRVASEGEMVELGAWGEPESDPKAIEIAESVMERLGGREAWAETRYLTWRFPGHRRHLWDRATGHLRLERLGPRTGKSYVILLDLDTGSGRAWREGEEVTAPDELDGLLDAAVGAWINDSYWLLMPYKLMDPGVTLRYLGPGETEAGAAADVLELTFEDVGRTPQNKYHVWVGRESRLVEQWAFFADAGDDEPAFTCPWRGWRRHGDILLSGDRGAVGGREFRLEEIAVFDELPESYFTSPEPIDWEKLPGLRESRE